MKTFKIAFKIYIYKILNTLSYKKPNIKPKSIIILRTDAIGDYLLFCNFLKVIRGHFKDYNITLVGNNAYKDLCLSLSSKWVDSIIWINRNHFLKKSLYTISLLRKLKLYKYDILINPIYSRDLINILIAKSIYANEKFAPSGDYINIDKNIKIKSDRIYTKLFPSKNEVIFEFYRNAEFFSKMLNKNINIKARLDTEPFKTKPSIKNYCILFIGANALYRKWGINNFAKIGIYLIQKYNQNILICGGIEDKDNAKILQNLITNKILDSKKVLNMVGKTTLIELATLILHTNLTISNETSCAHFSALLDTNVIVISNGNHLGRFTPYPYELSNKYKVIFHPFIEANIKKYKELSNKFKYKSNLNINEITTSKVIEKIDEIFIQDINLNNKYLKK
ncbi:glycosyltransferase family 9 protein [Helicobacter sp. MIT 14-3879]|uniref:glycosyltransferase family 9 protein n=1 Tax=Helicobacter sp. MIT 14-3879 TaxID=2040649 RepID=UPI0015F12C4E|nr:glycosyltransferase family 9 protein [Helicobacter sp. MIT 14-3879]